MASEVVTLQIICFFSGLNINSFVFVQHLSGPIYIERALFYTLLCLPKITVKQLLFHHCI
jgi:hypothetical protein